MWSSPDGSPTRPWWSARPSPTSAGRRGDLDALAGATVAGHVIECGAQATGGNFSFFTELPDRGRRPGFPIAEVAADGDAVITKHPGTGGAVTVETVTAQLLYEIGAPQYLGPDVTARFDTIQLGPDGPDRVRVHGVRGEPPPGTRQGRRQHARRLPQCDVVRPLWTRHRGEGRPRPRSAGSGRRPGRADLAVGPDRPRRRDHRGSGQRSADGTHPGPRREAGRPGVLAGRGRARPGVLPGLHADHAARRREPVRRVHRRVPPTVRCGACRGAPGRHPACRRPARPYR